MMERFVLTGGMVHGLIETCHHEVAPAGRHPFGVNGVFGGKG